MRVLFLLAEFPKLSETFIVWQINQLKELGIEVEVAALGNPGEEKVQPESEKILPSVTYPPFWAKNFLKPVFFVQKYRNSVDLIHAHFGFAGKVAAPAAKKLHIPLVVSYYGIDASPLRNSYSDYSQLFEIADKVLVLSKDMSSDLEELGCPGEKIIIQHIGVDPGKIPEWNSDFSAPFKIVSVGRFVEKKGFDVLINAVSRLENINFQLDLIGGGPLEQDLRDLVTENKLAGRVNFLGYLPYKQVLQHVAEADLFCLASKTAKSGDKEGTPMVLIEAQAMGVPTVSTKHAGIPGVVLNGKTGLIVPENNAEAFADALTTLFNNSDLAKQFSNQAKKHAAGGYNIEKQAGKLKQLYEQLI